MYFGNYLISKSYRYTWRKATLNCLEKLPGKPSRRELPDHSKRATLTCPEKAIPEELHLEKSYPESYPELPIWIILALKVLRFTFPARISKAVNFKKFWGKFFLRAFGSCKFNNTTSIKTTYALKVYLRKCCCQRFHDSNIIIHQLLLLC